MPSTATLETPLPTEPLRDEHKDLIPKIDELAAAGDAIGVAPYAEQLAKVHASYTFLTTELIPHAIAEDKVLYAEVDRLIGTNAGTGATDTMRRDHEEVGKLTERLGELGGRLHRGELSEADQREARRVLYGLYALVLLHFAKEEEVYLPLLDRTITAAQAEHIFQEMAKVNVESGGTAHTH